MSLEDAIAANTAAIRDLIAALAAKPVAEKAAAGEGENSAPPPAAEKPKRAKAEKPAPESVVEAPAAVEPPAPAITYEDIRVPFLTNLVAKHGRDAGAALLEEFGVGAGGKLSEIPEARWVEVLASINARCAS